MLENVKKNLIRVSGRTGLVLKKHSPEILLVVGVTSIIGSTILACRATLKASAIIEEHNDKISIINQALEIGSDDKGESDYTEKDMKKDLTIAYVQTGLNFVKLYGPAVLLGAAGICCVVGGHGILKKRNAALVLAYKVVEEGFSAYRKRVVDELGEDKDYQFKHGLKQEEYEETEIDENGKKRKVKKTKTIKDPNGLSPYARFFDESCSEWSPTPEYNLLKLRTVQSYCNNILLARGHIFLNEVYDQLGIRRSGEGQVVGWILSKDGDNFVDFGIYDENNERRRAFVNGDESNILLDFNVNGLIYDKI